MSDFVLVDEDCLYELTFCQGGCDHTRTIYVRLPIKEDSMNILIIMDKAIEIGNEIHLDHPQWKLDEVKSLGYVLRINES